MSSRFDDLAKGSANGMSRRDVLRGALVGGFAAALAVFGIGKASADSNCQSLCGALYPPPRGKDSQNAYGKCVSECQACQHSGGTACVPGACCTGTQSCCSGACVELSSDNNNCGSCGNVCTGGATCVDGACVSSVVCHNCGGAVVCGSDGGPLGNCFGFNTTEGCECAEDFFCSGAQPCSSSADCPSGSVCTVGTCCGGNFCAPLCGSGGTFNANLQGGSGMTASGAVV